ncbi:hypothetical protein ACUY1T_21830 [Billgrantia sp. Q4P2]|uniref:hypothetical protein n=1 Tax=Billgrantia sp. Q4P2 TaxID=3463857 RepID=UPI0040573D32
MMTNGFQGKVQAVLAEFLSAKGFEHEESKDLDGGNKSLVFYRSPQCKLSFYRSRRDGEVNCLVGTVGASNVNLESNEWLFLNSLLSSGKNLSIEELLVAVPDSPKSDEEQLCEIAIKLKENFDEFVNKLSKK